MGLSEFCEFGFLLIEALSCSLAKVNANSKNSSSQGMVTERFLGINC